MSLPNPTVEERRGKKDERKEKEEREGGVVGRTIIIPCRMEHVAKSIAKPVESRVLIPNPA